MNTFRSVVIVGLLLLAAACSDGLTMEPTGPSRAFSVDSIYSNKQFFTPAGTAYRRIYLYPAGGTNRAQIMVRSDYAGQPVHAFLLCHGSGGNEKSMNVAPLLDMANAIVDDGSYVIIQAHAGGDKAGNAAGIQDYSAAYGFADRSYNLDGTALYAGSAGGLPCLNLIERGTVGNVFAYVGAASVTSLRALWDHPFYDYKTWIKNTYFPGRPKTTANYETYTAGFDPNLLPTSAFAGVAYRMYASPEDSTVLMNHAVDWLSKVGSVAADTQLVVVGGGHHDTEFYQPASTLDFLQTWAP